MKYVAHLEDHYDDYKRPETSTKIVGTYATFVEAVRAGVRAAFDAMYHDLSDKLPSYGAEEAVEEEEEDWRVTAAKRYCIAAFEASGATEENASKLLGAFKDAEEAFLEREQVFTHQSSGVRLYIEKTGAVVDDEDKREREARWDGVMKNIQRMKAEVRAADGEEEEKVPKKQKVSE